jgi:hypothetical protein
MTRWAANFRGWRFDLHPYGPGFVLEIRYDGKLIGTYGRSGAGGYDGLMRSIQLLLDCEKREPKPYEIDLVNHTFLWIGRMVKPLAVEQQVRFRPETSLGRYLNYLLEPLLPRLS